MSAALHTIERLTVTTNDIGYNVLERIRVSGGWLYIYSQASSTLAGCAVASSQSFVPDVEAVPAERGGGALHRETKR